MAMVNMMMAPVKRLISRKHLESPGRPVRAVTPESVGSRRVPWAVLVSTWAVSPSGPGVQLGPPGQPRCRVVLAAGSLSACAQSLCSLSGFSAP